MCPIDLGKGQPFSIFPSPFLVLAFLLLCEIFYFVVGYFFWKLQGMFPPFTPPKFHPGMFTKQWEWALQLGEYRSSAHLWLLLFKPVHHHLGKPAKLSSFSIFPLVSFHQFLWQCHLLWCSLVPGTTLFLGPRVAQSQLESASRSVSELQPDTKPISETQLVFWEIRWKSSISSSKEMIWCYILSICIIYSMLNRPAINHPPNLRQFFGTLLHSGLLLRW